MRQVAGGRVQPTNPTLGRCATAIGPRCEEAHGGLCRPDLASNNGGWQWVAGSDAAPYYRIFKPVTQAGRFDPDGEYVRRWVPGLAELPAPAIFAPWQAAASDLEAAVDRPGTDYPRPIVGHRRARDRALGRFQEASARRS